MAWNKNFDEAPKDETVLARLIGERMDSPLLLRYNEYESRWCWVLTLTAYWDERMTGDPCLSEKELSELEWHAVPR